MLRTNRNSVQRYNAKLDCIFCQTPSLCRQQYPEMKKKKQYLLIFCENNILNIIELWGNLHMYDAQTCGPIGMSIWLHYYDITT